jgi:hypothetical protein
MSTNSSEERALEVMRKELASERVPDLPWDDMERSLMARLDEAPMTSQPRSLDARVDDVPASSVRHPRMQFVRVGVVVFAAAAAFALFWISPLHSGKPIVISTATPSVSAAAEVPPRTITANDAKAAFMTCVATDKRYGNDPAEKLKGEKLVVFLESDGRVATIRFDSPVEHSVMPCVFEALRPGRFVGTTNPVTIQF